MVVLNSNFVIREETNAPCRSVPTMLLFKKVVGGAMQTPAADQGRLGATSANNHFQDPIGGFPIRTDYAFS